MATLSTLVQNAVILDFQTDAHLNQYPIRARDYGGRKAGDDIYPNSNNQNPVVITVSVRDTGEAVPYTAIFRLIVEVQIIYNGAADNFEPTASLLDTLAEAAGDRLQGSNNLGVPGREQAYATSSSGTLKIYEIRADLPGRHEVSGFQRIRTVSRTFIAAHIAGPAL